MNGSAGNSYMFAISFSGGRLRNTFSSSGTIEINGNIDPRSATFHSRGTWFVSVEMFGMHMLGVEVINVDDSMVE